MDEEPKNPSPAIAIRERIRKVNPLKMLSQGIADNQITAGLEEALMGSEQFLSRFPSAKASAIIRGLENLSKPDHKKYYSLIDLIRLKSRKDRPEGLSLREINHLFDPYLGSLVLPNGISLEGSPLSGFFNQHRIFQDGVVVELRGDNYLVALNTHKKTTEKFEIIEKDLLDGIEILSRIKREKINNPKDYLLYLGVLDYLKMHSVTLFNALTYPERFGKYLPPESQEERKYLEYREKSMILAKLYTRMFYQALFGAEFDESSDLNPQNIKQLISYINSQMLLESAPKKLGKLSFARIRYPEINHPLVISLGSQEAVRAYSNADTVIGIPTGGTEVAIVVQLLYELLGQKITQLGFFPLSLHSEIHTQPTSGQLSEEVRRFLEEMVRNKNVVLIDDNAASGKTLSMVKAALIDNLAASVVVHLAEFDGRKLTEPISETDSSTFFNQRASLTTMGIHRFGAKPGSHAYREIIRSKLQKMAIN